MVYAKELLKNTFCDAVTISHRSSQPICAGAPILMFCSYTYCHLNLKMYVYTTSTIYSLNFDSFKYILP